MCTSMVNIQSPTAEIRPEKMEKKRKIETTAAKYNALPIPMGGHNKLLLTVVPLVSQLILTLVEININLIRPNLGR